MATLKTITRYLQGGAVRDLLFIGGLSLIYSGIGFYSEPAARTIIGGILVSVATIATVRGN